MNVFSYLEVDFLLKPENISTQVNDGVRKILGGGVYVVYKLYDFSPIPPRPFLESLIDLSCGRKITTDIPVITVKIIINIVDDDKEVVVLIHDL